MTTLAHRLAALPDAERAAVLGGMSPEQLAALQYSWGFWARPDQLPPPGDWRTWLLLGGRGSGKTRSAAEWIREQAESGKRAQVGVVGPTADSLRRIMVEGPSGILAVAPPWCRPTFGPATRTITWPSGCVAHLFSAEEPDRLRGPNLDAAWCDELCSWEHAEAMLDMLNMALRLPGPKGDAPQLVISTTPKPLPVLKAIMAAPSTVVTRARTLDNAANLDASTLRYLTEKYGGTTLGRQELDAELLDSAEGALWSREMLDRTRVPSAPELTRIAIGLDPSGTRRGDIAGIVAVGLDRNSELHVIGDYSAQLSPDGWARKAVQAYRQHLANFIVAEVNYGAEMVVEMIRQVDASVPVRTVHASRGKAVRAEPVSMLWEQGRAHVVGVLPALEDELCQWTPDGSGPSPGRMDSLVWAATELTIAERAKPARFVRLDFMGR